MSRYEITACASPSNRKTKQKLVTAIAVASFVSMEQSQAPAADDSEPAKPLRLCADPANLPFSSKNPKIPGVHLEIGTAVAKAMKRDFEPVWTLTYFGKRSVRTTLLAGQCDYFVGLPNDEDFMGKRVIFTRTIFTVGYALVTPKTARAAILKGQKVGVQFNTGPQNVLAPRNDIETETFLEPEEAMKSLAAKKIDAAVIWAPIASYMNQSQYGSAYTITPISGPGMQWAAAIGFAAKDKDLRDATDKILAGMGDGIKSTLAKYDFPIVAPIELTVQAASIEPSAPAALQHAGGEAIPTLTLIAANEAPKPAQPEGEGSKDAGKTADMGPTRAVPGPEAIVAGKSTFNGTCAHCHGPDAIQSDRHIDLRRLKHKYDADMDEVFMKTVHEGRPTKGMPTWTGVFTEEQLGQILAYLHTVQTPGD